MEKTTENSLIHQGDEFGKVARAYQPAIKPIENNLAGAPPSGIGPHWHPKRTEKPPDSSGRVVTNILYLMSCWEEMINDRYLIGLMRKGFELNKNLFVFPFKPNLYNSGDVCNEYSLPYYDFPLDDIIKKLRQGFFDIAFISNLWGILELLPFYRYILSFLGDTPSVIISEWQSEIEPQWDAAGFPDINVIAKFYSDKHHDWEGYPISYSIMGEETRKETDKSLDTFWAGSSERAILEPRKTFLETLLQAGYENIYTENYPPTEEKCNYTGYLSMLRKARISFSFPHEVNNGIREIEGAGQCTCMFIHSHSRDIIEVCDDFTDGVNAVFFENENDLLAKLDYFLSNKEKLMKIAEAGYSHVMNHHLVEHCADYVLGIVGQLL